MKSTLALLLLLLSLPTALLAIGRTRYVETAAGARSFPLVGPRGASPTMVDSADWPGVIRAVSDLRDDIQRVTNLAPSIVPPDARRSETMVLIGTVGKSPLIDQLIRDQKLDVSGIQGKWESFFLQTVENPLPGIASALVIAGSDKRGTIYGIYDLSEQIGVSPWYWWADVTPDHKDALFIKAGKYQQGEPRVKYRGIFFNDEKPDLDFWVRAKYGERPSPVSPTATIANFNSRFYGRVFEVLLRLKGNYLWPAMWNNAFAEDDPDNPRLADEYGIVMGTSHQEPMLRAQKEWDWHQGRQLRNWNFATQEEELTGFWRDAVKARKNFENIYTIGLRGENDTAMVQVQAESIRLLQSIVEVQRRMLAEEVNSDVTKVPQVWTLYKEVQQYYENGLRVPDDVTLLWAEDNWGNVRRLPSKEERPRPGGAGVYYHFDYHGGPRSYQWINTSPIAKIWDQMSLTKQYGADRIWIVNVELFKADADLMTHFNKSFAGGKWDHFMDQSHIGYTSWADPPENTLNAIRLSQLQVGTDAKLGVAVEGSTAAWPGAEGQPALPKFDALNQQRQFIDVFNRGMAPYPFTAAVSAPWIVLSESRGVVEKEKRLWVTVNWNRAPRGAASGEVKIAGAGGEVVVKVDGFNPAEVTRASLQGFAEGQGVVSIEPEHFTKKNDAGANRWIRIEDYGRTLSGMRAEAPVDTGGVTPGKDSPSLEYRMYVFTPGAVNANLILSPTLNFVAGRGLRVAVSFDDEAPKVVDILPANYNAANGNRDWEESVRNNARTVSTTHTLADAGYHTLKVWMVDPAVVVQKIVVSTSSAAKAVTYLGPPESFHR